MSKVAITRLSYPCVRSAVDLFFAGGRPATRLVCGGRTKGNGLVLSAVQEQAIEGIIIRNRPEQLKMDFGL